MDKENSSNKIDSVFINDLLYVKTKLSPVDLKIIKEKSDYILKNSSEFSKNNKTLSGNIEKEYYVDTSVEEILSPYCFSLADKFYEKVKGLDQKKSNWILASCWINFQKKYEFNPLHTHSGEYSFVLWVQIPYDLNEELQLQNCKNSNKKCNSLFAFFMSDLSGSIRDQELKIDKTWEGTLILFPSSLAHQVFPFYTSDDYRISISGNLYMLPPSKKTFSYQ